jgi:hypothetical protein
MGRSIIPSRRKCYSRKERKGFRKQSRKDGLTLMCLFHGWRSVRRIYFLRARIDWQI